MMNTIKLIILVMACYSVCMTVYSHNLPNDVRDYVTGFSSTPHTKSLEEINTNIESNLQEQTKIPLIEMGALIFYSGNLFIDLALNFIYAIPEMLTLVIYGIMQMLNIDTTVLFAIQALLTVLITIMYFLGFIEFLISLRQGGSNLA